jgi:hypothetical protein
MGISRDGGRRETLFGVVHVAGRLVVGYPAPRTLEQCERAGVKTFFSGPAVGKGCSCVVRRRSGRGLAHLLRGVGRLVDFGSRLESSRRLQQPTFSQDRLGQLSRKIDRLAACGSAISRVAATAMGSVLCVGVVWADM